MLGKVAAVLVEGGIVALKGLGGFQLLCRADSEEAVSRLRQGKGRPSKPLAVMVNLEEAGCLAVVDEAEAKLLQGAENAIVLLRARPERRRLAVAASVAPGVNRVGLFLPSTPLHGCCYWARWISLWW